MVGILAQVDDIFSWAPRGGKLIGTGWGMRIQGHGYLNILCRCNIRRSAREQREHGFLRINITHINSRTHAGLGGSPNKCNVKSRACSRSGGFALPALALMWLKPSSTQKRKECPRGGTPCPPRRVRCQPRRPVAQPHREWGLAGRVEGTCG